ncbi:vacuolar membrane zinc transporter [Schizosaccharomyces cryophilus OY26]|uniref:Vacuolar membrane zinc transporter n=1 Tax=Schizosaccharomyces cryophilus (strain OY26 / ATCC MYA-4695 / CBS 11777 / NBRC 106824 / NRRL Y48691) TaxID=653667 RepID=S9VYD1_SCHCR|nr:vacuolar membrane zinc transporter [Schizosaccharomyces cryophilus OY26]EPY51269.1 vacuolar membrane zinc transporter [Schizosaccharomyces cryophilus OY26]
MDNSKGWILSLISNCFCILGASGVWIDVVANKLLGRPAIDLVNSERSLVTALATSAGILLFSSWSSVMEESLHFFLDVPMIDMFLARIFQLTSFFLGSIFFYGFTHFLHKWLRKTNDSSSMYRESRYPTAQNSSRSLSSSHSDSASLQLSSSIHGSHCPSGSHLHERSMLLPDDGCPENGTPPTGESNPKAPTCECECHNHFDLMTTVFGSEEDEHLHSVYTMGIQTAFLICLHKIPEGFITYLASTVDTGFMVFVAMTIHNMVEGFTVAYPLYLAWKSRRKAFLTAASLSSLSLPLGALIAFLLVRIGASGSFDLLNFVYGFIFASTAGMMLILSLRVIFPEALRHDHSQNKRHSVLCFIFGILGTLCLEVFHEG